MQKKAPYTAAAIRSFARNSLAPLLAEDFSICRNGDLVRLVGNFAQIVVMTGGRYGDLLKVHPTFYVVGTRPWDEFVNQSVALDNIDPNRWRFSRALDESLARDVAQLLDARSPLSFLQPITPNQVVDAMVVMAKRATIEDAALHLAFFLMANDLGDPQHWLDRADRIFQRANLPLRQDWQRTLQERMEALKRRVDAPQRSALCREEAQRHAAVLKLPEIAWG